MYTHLPAIVYASRYRKVPLRARLFFAYGRLQSLPRPRARPLKSGTAGWTGNRPVPDGGLTLRKQRPTMEEIKLEKNNPDHSDPAAGITGTELLKTRGKAMLKKVTVRLAMVAMTELVLSGTAFSAPGGAMTEVGTPRA